MSRKIHKYSSVFIYVFFQILLLTISVTALYNNVQSLYKAYFAIAGKHLLYGTVLHEMQYIDRWGVGWSINLQTRNGLDFSRPEALTEIGSSYNPVTRSCQLHGHDTKYTSECRF